LDDFFIAINAYNTLKNSINNVLSVYNSLYENDLYIRDYLDFINNSNCESNLGNINILPHEIQSIKFDGVYFKYPNKTDYALKNINLEIKKNDKIAIVGSNGSGKTTIIKLIIRLYEVEKGTILLNNIDIKQYNIMSLRRCVAILFQDYTMYPFTIKENITFGKHIINKDLYQVLDRVDMLDKVQNLPLTIETPITSQLSDHGIELSGGESQRIAISRILIQKNEVLVLDEPTSNLDPIIEKQLYETLLNEMHSNILIIISHRFSFTYKLQKIICISNGSIVEYGSHDELMKLNGYYKKLYDLSCSNSIS
jgi:ABC-type multidrug transport system fused ATPase/permease subunit